MVELIHYFIYPQYIWAKEIDLIFKSGIIEEIDKRMIIDAPSGKGVISYWLSKDYPGLVFLLCDINANYIDFASKHIQGGQCLNEDIFHLTTRTFNNVWVFINSLFCLPEAEKLIGHMSSQMEYIIGVFDYISSANYYAFLSAHPGYLNPSAAGKDDTIKLFEKFGYKTIFQKDVTYIHYQTVRSSVLRKVGLRAFSLIEKIWRSNNPAYWLAVFKRASIENRQYFLDNQADLPRR
jgi:hypothetical protein